MYIKRKTAAAAALVLSLASLALASDALGQAGKTQGGREWSEQRGIDHSHDKPSMSKGYGAMDWAVPAAASSCPKLEGYPDCR